ncbi:ParB/RepB/Spo0J family partition protein [Azohydromonas aeria]|uniref:ParB/RepB/Spo0J family partition protein n=1 Tax=Azohydromonas aeria TaxID=2590212 RepID=UPI0012F96FFF|nr:ParB/RepB/Spo0J family partition protein [Azohydromonas aeria]
MSTKRREKVGENIAFVIPEARTKTSEAVPEPAPQPAVKTGVGYTTAAIFNTNALRGKADELQREVESLKALTQELENDRGAQLLDAARILPSRWANRADASFSDQEFLALKAEIQDAGGNVQPIMVRPMEGEGGRYELVFGHRRHRACLDLGLPVLAVIKPLGDRELFAHMERENRHRKNLSPYEQGQMYRRALAEGLFPSMRALAADIGRGSTDVSEAVRIAELPQAVLDAFSSPNDIQFRWAKALSDACQRDPAGVKARAREVRADRLPAVAVFKVLVSVPGGEGARPSSTSERKLALGPGREGVIRRTGKRVRVELELDPAQLPAEQWEAFEERLRHWLG